MGRWLKYDISRCSEHLASMGNASMSVLSANFGSPFPMVARMPVSAMGCL